MAEDSSRPFSKQRYLIIFMGVTLFALLKITLPFEPALVTGLSILVLVALLWLTEALPVSVTALLVPILTVTNGVMDARSALSHFADPIIFLFLGGFALAAALRAQGLDQAIANQALSLARGNLRIAIYLLFLVTAALSMWISNTATTAMMLPLMLGLLAPLSSTNRQPTYHFALLGIAYCASIGGIATLVGSPPNAIAAAQSKQNFSDWMQMAMPLTLLLLLVTPIVLHLIIRPDLNQTYPVNRKKMSWSSSQFITLAIFTFTALCWIFSGVLSDWLGGVSKLDSLIAIAAIILLCSSGVISWREIEKQTDWGVLLLFGGGLCLSAMLKTTGTSLFFAETLSHYLDNSAAIVVLFSIVIFVVVLTEFASNTASAALLVPVFASVADSLGVSPTVIATVVGVSASCAFMLPVATPPNAIVYGSGFVPQPVMMRAGIWLNICCIFIISIYASLFWTD